MLSSCDPYLPNLAFSTQRKFACENREPTHIIHFSFNARKLYTELSGLFSDYFWILKILLCLGYYLCHAQDIEGYSISSESGIVLALGDYFLLIVVGVCQRNLFRIYFSNFMLESSSSRGIKTLIAISWGVKVPSFALSWMKIPETTQYRFWWYLGNFRSYLASTCKPYIDPTTFSLKIVFQN